MAERNGAGQQQWLVAWKGEDIVAMVNAQFVKCCYLM